MEAAKMVRRRNKNSTSRKKGMNTYYDYTLLFITFFMVCFGLIMIYSTSSYIAQRDFNDSTKFVKGQGIAIILGLFAMIAVSKIDYRIFRKKLRNFNVNIAMLLFFLCVFLQFFVLVFGVESHGKKRWINLGFTTFQPSELSKVAIIIFMAYLIQKAPRTTRIIF